LRAPALARENNGDVDLFSVDPALVHVGKRGLGGRSRIVGDVGDAFVHAEAGVDWEVELDDAAVGGEDFLKVPLEDVLGEFVDDNL
jgi:hypothetical protein